MIPDPLAEAEPPDFARISRQLWELSPLPMVAVDGIDHVVHYANPAFSQLVGVATETLTGRPFVEAVPEGTENGCAALLARVFRTGIPENLADQLHRQTRTLSVHWSYAAWAILDASGTLSGIMVQVADSSASVAFRSQAAAMNESLILATVRQHELIEALERGEAERRELETKMFQARKHESLGILAGGIAHDLNNLLTPVIGYAILAREQFPPQVPTRWMLDEVEKNARRAADLVQQILAYAGKARFVLEPVDLSQLVRDSNTLLKSKVPATAVIQYHLAPLLPTLQGDVGQLRQAILNLVINAAEALPPTGGTITLRTSVTFGAEPSSSQCVFLEVSDTGGGIPPAALENIFDPFFTTKFTGRGLGLAVVQGIVRGHGGRIEVRSEVDHGTSFAITLPVPTPPEPDPRAATTTP